MKIIFTSPVMVGDIGKQFAVASMDVTTVSFNLAPGDGNTLVGLTLRDPITGFQQYFAYEDANSTPAFWNQVKLLAVNGKSWVQLLLERLVADNKLPTGSIS